MEIVLQGNGKIYAVWFGKDKGRNTLFNQAASLGLGH